jgi:prepilin-type N-terminal cleavage/methylation domain-containing protein
MKNRYCKQNSQRGFTLIEMLVAIGVFAVVVAIATGGFVNSLRTQRQVASLISAQSNASLVLEQMAREIRTGFLFCHDQGNNTGLNNNCNNPPGAAPGDPDFTPTSGCTEIDSGYAYSALDTIPQGSPGAGDLPVWDCPSLDYFNTQGEHVNYSLQNGALMRSDSAAVPPTPQSITGNGVTVKSLHFIIFGNIEGDSWTPRVTIAIGVVPSSTDPAVNSDVLNLETTISARTIDCYSDSNGAHC